MQNLKTISFIGNSEPPDKLLNLFKKFTPGQNGIWGQLKGIPSYDSDYYGVIDGLPSKLKSFEPKCVFLGAHPPESHYAYCNMKGFKGIKMYDAAEVYGFGEWWLKYDYDYLSNLQPMKKTKELAAIVSDANTQSYHKARRMFLSRFCYNKLENFNLYGRIRPWSYLKKYYRGHCGSSSDSAEYNNDHMSGKETVYEEHKYAIEFDATAKHYFSERVFDCLLLWCHPIYSGGQTLHHYIPEKSFSYFNVNGYGKDVHKIIKDNTYEDSLPYMKEARDLLLNKLQLWPRIHEAIFGTTK